MLFQVERSMDMNPRKKTSETGNIHSGHSVLSIQISTPGCLGFGSFVPKRLLLLGKPK